MTRKRYIKQSFPSKHFKKSNGENDEDLVVLMEEDELRNCIDLTRLPYLKDHIVLQSVIARYQSNKIYTWAGPVLVATNPNCELPGLYDDEVIQKIHTETKEGHVPQEPHIYTIAGLAYNRLLYELGLVNQAILVSGESGAGKTESARFLLTYLTKINTELLQRKSPNGLNKIDPALICNRILASNPILEAFGNAATLRNHNSSRFGKLIKLHYVGSQLMGAKLDTFLLEKSRVTHQPTNERNFHIFYQLIAGVEKGLLPELDLGGISFRIISSNTKNESKMDDLEGFNLTMKAFEELDFTRQQRQQIFELLLAILHLGNVSFSMNKNSEIVVINQEEDCQLSMSYACSLLGLHMEDLVEAFTVRKISVVIAGKETVYMKPCERIDQCEGNRDALMQLLYTAAFSYLVAVINKQLSVQCSQRLHYIAILDVYGFETYDENSLEQLCINYANERLQQEFVRRYLSSEQKILSEEGFVNMPKTITDNSKCVSALDSPVSVFAILNEECQLKRALNEGAACDRVCSALQKTGFVSPLNWPAKMTGFSVRHFAGSVNYTSKGILLKNKDEIPKEVVAVLEMSKNKFVSEVVFGLQQGEVGKNKKITTLLKFKGSLDSLMKTMTVCDLHYIRCIKPNATGCPGEPDKDLLLNQLRSNGILDTVNISQAGYSMRMLYVDFVKRYCTKDSHYNERERTFLTTCEILGDDGEGHPKEADCRFGRTRIFLSECSLRKLEDVRSERRNQGATCIQKNYRRYKDRLFYKKMKAAAIIIQTAIRVCLCRRKYEEIHSSIICIQKNVKMLNYRKRYLRMRTAVIILQKYTRRWLRRSKSVCPSRLSMASTGYSSMSSAQYTDHSVSDVETIPISDLLILSNRRLIETEESGIETDTESLSGVKSGKNAKQRIRRHPQRSANHGVAAKGNHSDTKRHRKNSTPGPTKSHGPPSRPLNYFTEISNMLKTCGPTEVLQLCLPVRNQSVFYKDGVLSCHRISKTTKIKFHTRQTCLPYSTYRPMHECSQGLLDAL